MRILAHVHGYPPVHGAGAEYALHGVLKWLVSRGHRVTVVCPSRCEDGERDGVKVQLLTGGVGQLKALYAAADVAITHLDLTSQVMSMARAYRKPVVHYVHNSIQLDHHKVKPNGGVPQLAMFNSYWLRDEATWAGDSVVVWPPVNEADYKVQGSGHEVVLANLNKNKGADTFWSVAKQMPRRNFLGVKGAYEQQIVPYPQPKNAEVIPNQRDMRTVYERARAVLMPSAYESWGRVAMEAAVSGIPTICHPTPGLCECMGDAAIYVHRDDVDGYVRELRRLSDARAYRTASRAARKQFESYRALMDEQLGTLERALLRLLEAAQPEVAVLPPEAYFNGAHEYLVAKGFRFFGRAYRPGDVATGLPDNIANAFQRRGMVERI